MPNVTGDPQVLPSGTSIIIDSNAILDVDDTVVVGSLEGASGAEVDIQGSNSLAVGSNVVGSSSKTYEGELAGSGQFIKQGTGGLILTGSSSSFSGDTLVEAGQLILQDSGADALGSSSSSPGTVTVEDGATLVFENNGSSFLFILK